MYAPIALFVYDRLDHLKETVEALRKNPEAKSSDLIVFSDASRSDKNINRVERVREYISTVSGFKSISINHRVSNFGLARSITEGVSEVLAKYESVIVLEDDIVTSPYFLAFMNESLVRFQDDERVISVHGYVYSVRQALPEAFFIRGADCWGWATWRRGWNFYNPDGLALLNELKRSNLLEAFDFNGTYNYSGMLQAQVEGRNDSWAIRWYASAFLANKLTLYPGRSLAYNIGNDGSGTHCRGASSIDVELSKTRIDLSAVKVEPSEEAYLVFENFFRHNRRSIVKWITSLAGKFKEL